MTNKEKAIVKQHVAREWESVKVSKSLYGTDAEETKARRSAWAALWSLARNLGCSVDELLVDMK